MTYVDATIGWGRLLILHSDHLRDMVWIHDQDDNPVRLPAEDGREVPACIETGGQDLDGGKLKPIQFHYHDEAVTYAFVGVTLGNVGEYTPILGKIEATAEQKAEAEQIFESITGSVLAAPLKALFGEPNYYIMWGHS